MLRREIKKALKNIFIELPHFVKVPILSYLKPRGILVELTNVCNLLCPFCPTTTGLERPVGQMSLEKFKYIVDHVKPYVRRMTIYYMGESLLNKSFFDMVRYCMSNGITPCLVTNGMLIDKYLDDFIDSGIPGISVAIDGYNKETHEKYRIKSDFDKIINNIKMLVEKKKEHNSSTPRITIQTLTFGFNDEEKMKDLAREIGADGVKFKAPRLTDHKHDFDSDQFEDFIPRESQYLRLEGKNETPFAKNMKYCPYMRVPVITWDGQVLPCCFDMRGKSPIGNIFNDDLLSILRSKRYRKVLSQFFNKSLPICSSCDGLYTP